MRKENEAHFKDINEKLANCDNLNKNSNNLRQDSVQMRNHKQKAL